MQHYRPDVVVTYFDNSGYNHPDHVKAHDITRKAIEATGIPRKLYLIARPRSYTRRVCHTPASSSSAIAPASIAPRPGDVA